MRVFPNTTQSTLFLPMTRIFLTGATGFLGSKILRHLLREGHTVAALVRPESDLWRVRDCLAQTILIDGRVEEVSSWRDALADFQPQGVIHAAWDGVGNTERDNPRQAENIVSTTRLAVLSAELGTSAFVGLGSQAEYGAANRIIDETAPTLPTTLYGMAKLAAGQMCEAICAQRGVRFAWIRIFSTYGPGDNGGWLFPYILSALQKGERPSLTTCEQRWDYLYGEDAASAIAGVALTAGAEGVFNLGSGQAPPLKETVEMLRDLAAPGAELGFGEVSFRKDQVMHLQADIARLTKATGWVPRWSLREGLAETVRDFDARNR